MIKVKTSNQILKMAEADSDLQSGYGSRCHPLLLMNRMLSLKRARILDIGGGRGCIQPAIWMSSSS